MYGEHTARCGKCGRTWQQISQALLMSSVRPDGDISLQFTPEPWAIVHEFHVVGPDGFGVAACDGYSNSALPPGKLDAVKRANTALVRAAPTLYRGCADALAYLRQVGLAEELQRQLAEALAAVENPPTREGI